jgi:hypothetical protein
MDGFLQKWAGRVNVWRRHGRLDHRRRSWRVFGSRVILVLAERVLEKRINSAGFAAKLPNNTIFAELVVAGLINLSNLPPHPQGG